MNILTQLTDAQVVESTQETRDEVMKAIETIFSTSHRNPVVHMVLDEINDKAFICLYREPLLHISPKVISLERNNHNSWIPVEESIRLEMQLSRLNHGSQDSQQH